MSTRTERFLVTGASGCIGSWVIRLLLDEGVEVIASDLRKDQRRLDLVSLGEVDGVRHLDLDVTDASAVSATVAENQITHIVHLAGLQVPFCAANPPLGAQVNVGGTVNVFEAVKAVNSGIGLAYASSGAIFGRSLAYPGGVVSDFSVPAPETLYGVYKVANEGTARIYASDHGVGSIGLRPFVVYGPGRDQGRTSGPTVAMLAASAGVRYTIGLGGTSVMTYAEDCARTFIEAARAAAGTTDAVCANVPGQRMSVRNLVQVIESVRPEAAGLIDWDASFSRTPALLGGSNIEAVIGTSHNRSVRDGVRSTIEHFRRALDAGLVSAPGK
ncbi:NAD-dependent epimerase/dehydratase family protein [Rhodococcus sp. NPDC060176]|uniref:NAD-dependent epimerase/dehydratase family protein n=1 Tax=Rhodococcus sp. NPDC060176 TaxID=3347062 RepID=UPI00365E74E6